MARKQTGKPSGKVAKEKLQLTLDPDVAHKLRLAALASRMDLSEFVTAWVLKEYSGIHIRGFDKANELHAGVGQGGSSDTLTVAIPRGLTNRIGAIARAAHLPVDMAIESQDDDSLPS